MQAEDWTSIRKLLDDCAPLARDQGIAESGDLIAITAGLPAQGSAPTSSRSTEFPRERQPTASRASAVSPKNSASVSFPSLTL